jgi:hypothetical protein
MRCLWQLDRTVGEQRRPYLHAVLDAARDKRIYPGLRRFAATEEIHCLYQGRAATEMAAIAPYLVCVGTGGRLFDWLWDEGWGDSWGIFLWSLSSPTRLREHFRRLTIVQTVTSHRLLFRFYDPRVLREFLPMCDADQLREMFGPVQRYSAEVASGTGIVTATIQTGAAGEPMKCVFDSAALS